MTEKKISQLLIAVSVLGLPLGTAPLTAKAEQFGHKTTSSTHN